ncbi:MAG: ribokinase [Terriglobia bacterium]
MEVIGYADAACVERQTRHYIQAGDHARAKGGMMAKQSYIAVVGSANVDLTTFIDEFPRPGETIFGRKFDLGFGGKGANQAVAARLCGASVAMVAKVGSDLFGPATIKNFESLGIDASHVGIAEGVSSGVAPIFVDQNGQNRIIVVKGANDTLSPEDVDAAAPLLRKADTIVLQFEIPLGTVYHTIRFAKSNGILCIVNPAPALPVDFREAAAADYFIPNESEAEVITGMPVHSLDDAKKCADYLLRQGIHRVVITLGERGSLLAGPIGMELIPAFKVEAIDSTGAGDAFIGSFAVFLAEGLPDKEALARASLYAALSTTKVGTQKSFQNRSDFDKEWQNRGAGP